MNYEFTLTFDGDDYKIVVDGNSVLVNGQPFVVGFDPDGGHVLVDGIPFDVTFDPQAEQALVGGIARTVTVEGLEAEKPGPRAAGPAGRVRRPRPTSCEWNPFLASVHPEFLRPRLGQG